MGLLKPFVAQHRQRTTTHRALRPLMAVSEFYGDPVPATAWLIERYVHTGRIPVRDPDDADRVVSINLHQAAETFGGDPAETRRYLHRKHAAGQLTIDPHGTVDVAQS